MEASFGVEGHSMARLYGPVYHESAQARRPGRGEGTPGFDEIGYEWIFCDVSQVTRAIKLRLYFS